MNSNLYENKKLVPLSDIMSQDDVRILVDSFILEDMADARKLIILWEDREGKICLRTNVSNIRCGQIFRMAFEAIEK